MLLEFTVGNYKSIAAPQKLTMVPSSSTSLRSSRTLETGSSFAPRVLKSLCLLGPNGSGKSSVIGAMDFVGDFIRGSATQMTEGDEIDVTPFKLDPSTVDEPSYFEIIFVIRDALYQYGFTTDQTRIHEEWLFSRSNETGSRIRNLFQRIYVPETGDYDWSINENRVKGERETWRKATRSNALFLSTAVQLNSESLREPFIWLSQYLRVLPAPDRVSPRFTETICRDPKRKAEVANFIRSADISISDIEITEVDMVVPKQLEQMVQETVLSQMREMTKKRKQYETSFCHETRDGGIARLDFKEESTGTQVLFALAGPWIDVLQNGYTLVVDELHNSLHPIALKHLVSMFYNPRVNRNGAQLIFSTHDVSVITRNLMHRDQVWLIEKVDFSSHLYPLSDFNMRDTESFAKGYLDGRFGGLPHTREFEFGDE